MIISRNILNYLDPRIKELSSRELSDVLTNLGLEVESVKEKFNNSEFEGLVFGLIQSVEKVENSEKLSFCKVKTLNKTAEIPAGTILEIVCGGSNVVEGYIGVIATTGQVLPIGIKIEERKILGIQSNGMICSLEELQLDSMGFHPQDGIVLYTEKQILNCDPSWKTIHEIKPMDILNDELYVVSTVENTQYLHNAHLLSKLIVWAMNTSGISNLEVTIPEHLENLRLDLSNINEVLNGTETQNGFLFKNVDKESLEKKASLIPISIMHSLNHIGYKITNSIGGYQAFLETVTGKPFVVLPETKADIEYENLSKNYEKYIKELDFEMEVGVKKFPKEFLGIFSEGKLLTLPFVALSKRIEMKDNEVFSFVIPTYNRSLARKISKWIEPNRNNQLELAVKTDAEYNTELLLYFLGQEPVLLKKKISVSSAWIFNNLNINNATTENNTWVQLLERINSLGIDVIEHEDETLEFDCPSYLSILRTKSDIIQLCFLIMSTFGISSHELHHHDAGYYKNKTVSKMQPNSLFYEVILDTLGGGIGVVPFILIGKAKYDKFLKKSYIPWPTHIEKINVKNPISPEHDIISPLLTFSLLETVQRIEKFKGGEIQFYAAQLNLPISANKDDYRFSERIAVLSSFLKKKNEGNTWNRSLDFNSILGKTKLSISFIPEKLAKYTGFVFALTKIFNYENWGDLKFKKVNSVKKIDLFNPYTLYIISYKGQEIGLIGEISPLFLEDKNYEKYFMELDYTKITELLGDNIVKKITSKIVKREEVKTMNYKQPLLRKSITLEIENINEVEIIKKQALKIKEIFKIQLSDVFEINGGIAATFQLHIYQKDVAFTKQEQRSILKKVIDMILKNNPKNVLRGTLE